MNDKNNGFFDFLKKINGFILTLEEILLVIITVGLCAVIFIEVLCRYILFTPTAWSEELARYLFIILTFIGAAYTCGHHDHIEIDIINQVLEKIPAIKDTARAKRMVDVVANITTIIFLVVFNSIFWGYMAQIRKLNLLSPTMHLPMFWIYFTVYLGGVLSIVHLIYLVLCDLFQADAA